LTNSEGQQEKKSSDKIGSKDDFMRRYTYKDHVTARSGENRDIHISRLFKNSCSDKKKIEDNEKDPPSTRTIKNIGESQPPQVSPAKSPVPHKVKPRKTSITGDDAMNNQCFEEKANDEDSLITEDVVSGHLRKKEKKK
jgi:hypothetical protein